MTHIRALLWRWRALLMATLLAAALALALTSSAGSIAPSRALVTTRDLPAGHIVDESDLTEVTTSSSLPGSHLDDVLGRPLAVGLREGTLLQDSMFRGDSLADLAPEGTIVVLVPLATGEDFTPVGSIIDVYSPPQEGETEATKVAENATVLAFKTQSESVFAQSMSDITTAYLAISETQAKLVLGISARTPMLAVLAR